MFFEKSQVWHSAKSVLYRSQTPAPWCRWGMGGRAGKGGSVTLCGPAGGDGRGPESRSRRWPAAWLTPVLDPAGQARVWQLDFRLLSPVLKWALGLGPGLGEVLAGRVAWHSPPLLPAWKAQTPSGSRAGRAGPGPEDTDAGMGVLPSEEIQTPQQCGCGTRKGEGLGLKIL